MTNPMKIYQIPNVIEEFYVFSGYVKSVTDRGTYNSVSLKVNPEDKGIMAPLISVRCYAQTKGVNHKKLVENAKGRFVTIFAIPSFYDGKTSYIARHISLAPREYAEKTHPFVDEIAKLDGTSTKLVESNARCNQITIDFDDYEKDSLPF